jgi:hypothetical protein
MKLLATRKRQQNRAAVDPWTAVHFAAGLAAGLMDVPRNVSLPAAVLYEIAEQYLERTRWGKELFETEGPESLPNVALDLAVFAAGQWAGERWNATGRGRSRR